MDAHYYYESLGYGPDKYHTKHWGYQPNAANFHYFYNFHNFQNLQNLRWKAVVKTDAMTGVTYSTYEYVEVGDDKDTRDEDTRDDEDCDGGRDRRFDDVGDYHPGHGRADDDDGDPDEDELADDLQDLALLEGKTPPVSPQPTSVDMGPSPSASSNASTLVSPPTSDVPASDVPASNVPASDVPDKVPDTEPLVEPAKVPKGERHVDFQFTPEQAKDLAKKERDRWGSGGAKGTKKPAKSRSTSKPGSRSSSKKSSRSRSEKGTDKEKRNSKVRDGTKAREKRRGEDQTAGVSSRDSRVRRDGEKSKRDRRGRDKESRDRNGRRKVRA